MLTLRINNYIVLIVWYNNLPLNKHPNKVDEYKLKERSKGKSKADDVVDVEGGGITHLQMILSGSHFLLCNSNILKETSRIDDA